MHTSTKSGPLPAVLFSQGTDEYNLLRLKLPRPPDRARRENAHRPAITKPARERWHETVKKVLRDIVDEDRFRYSPVEKGEIRILSIYPAISKNKPLKACMFKRKLTEVLDGYEALSYVWGHINEKPTHEIHIRDLNATISRLGGRERKKYDPAGAVFRIRQNLYQALVKMRLPTSSVNIWVDAICIDQSDHGKREKEEQLSHMADIYNSASNVCIWLGDNIEGSTDGIAMVRDIMNFKNFDILIDKPETRQRWAHLIELMKAPWFSRRWIIQEVALARNATIHCGEDVVHWDDFADAVSLLLEKIDTLRERYRDEIFDHVEATSASILVQTLGNLCRKSDQGMILSKLWDLETLISTLLGFQATLARDTIYSILSLARDCPEPNETWGGRQEPNCGTTSAPGLRPRAIGLTPNYRVSTRDLFVAFALRCIERSRSLDIICRHWAPPVTDQLYTQRVSMPSWVSEISRAPFGIPNTLLGRQNGENFVGYSPLDRRKRYNTAGGYPAEFRVVDDLPLSTELFRVPLTISDPFSLPPPVTGGQALDRPLSPVRENEDPEPGPSARLDPEPELEGRLNPASAEAMRDHPVSRAQHQDQDQNQDGDETRDDKMTKERISRASATSLEWMNRRRSMALPDGRNSAESSPFDSPMLSGSDVTEARIARLRMLQKQRASKLPDVERDHVLSGVIAVRGFVIGAITTQSDVIRGGIVPGNWIRRLGWSPDSGENRVPDTLWRLLVADRGPRGDNPPNWYQRACLHCLVDPRATDSEGNFHSVTPVDRKISEMTTRFSKRVEAVVWNRRIFEIDPVDIATKPDQLPPSPPPPPPPPLVELPNGTGPPPNCSAIPPITSQGCAFAGPLFGLAPKGSDEGDVVCVLFGCSVPVVLKKAGAAGVFELVGEAYVHGMMDGEAVQDQELVAGLSRDVWFTLI